MPARYWKMTKNEALPEDAEIFIYGEIGESMFSEGIGAKQFAKELKALGDIKTLTVRINSPGGSVFEGQAIYSQLKNHKAEKIVHIDGLAASIASVIAMSGDLIVMPENATMMIHDPTGMVVGTSEDMLKMAEALDTIKLGIIAAYRDKTGLSDEKISSLMSAETWMSAEDALKYGFADHIAEPMKMAASYDLSKFNFKNIPRNLGGINMKCSICGTELLQDRKCPTCHDKNYRKDMYAERERVQACMAMGKEFRCTDLANEAIVEGWSEDQLRTEILKQIKAKSPSSGPSFSTIGNPFPVNDGKPFGNFGEQLQAVVKSARTGHTDQRLLEITNAAAGMSEAVPSEGGFVVQSDFTTALLEKANETAVLAPLCYRVPVSGSGLKAPVIDETSRATGSRLGGVQAYWTAEATEVTAKKPKLAMLELSLKKLMGVSYATDELLEDQVALEAVITRGFTEEIGFLLDAAIVSGSGAGQPLGILNADCLVTVSKETGQIADTIVAENVINMYSRMHRTGKIKAVWLVNSECWPQLFQLSMTFGASSYPLFMPPGGLSQSPYGTLFGRPVIEVEQASALGDKGDIVFADLTQYLLIDKASGINTAVSIHVKFLTDETAFRFTYRCDGQPIWKSALTPYKGSATVSPFIALQAR